MSASPERRHLAMEAGDGCGAQVAVLGSSLPGARWRPCSSSGASDTQQPWQNLASGRGGRCPDRSVCSLSSRVRGALLTAPPPRRPGWAPPGLRDVGVSLQGRPLRPSVHPSGPWAAELPKAVATLSSQLPRGPRSKAAARQGEAGEQLGGREQSQDDGQTHRSAGGQPRCLPEDSCRAGPHPGRPSVPWQTAGSDPDPSSLGIASGPQL